MHQLPVNTQFGHLFTSGNIINSGNIISYGNTWQSINNPFIINTIGSGLTSVTSAGHTFIDPNTLLVKKIKIYIYHSEDEVYCKINNELFDLPIDIDYSNPEDIVYTILEETRLFNWLDWNLIIVKDEIETELNIEFTANQWKDMVNALS